MHRTLFSPHTILAPSGIRAHTEDMKLISIINNVVVVGNSKWKVEYLCKIESSDSTAMYTHKLAASAIHLWTIKTKSYLVILLSYQISIIL